MSDKTETYLRIYGPDDPDPEPYIAVTVSSLSTEDAAEDAANGFDKLPAPEVTVTLSAPDLTERGWRSSPSRRGEFFVSCDVIAMGLTPNEARELGTTLLLAADKAESKLPEQTRPKPKPSPRSLQIGFSFGPTKQGWNPIGYLGTTVAENDKLKTAGWDGLEATPITVKQALQIGVTPEELLDRVSLYADRPPFNQFTKDDGKPRHMTREQVAQALATLVEELGK